jgi:hypothetical protein
MIFAPYGIGLLQAQRMQQPQRGLPAASPPFGVPGQIMPQQPMLRQTSLAQSLPASAPMAAAQQLPFQPRPLMQPMALPPSPMGMQPQGAPAQPAQNKPPAPQGQRPQGQGFLGMDPQTWFDIAGGFMSGAQNNDWSQALFGIGGALDARRGRQDAQMERKWQDEQRGLERERAGRERTAFKNEQGELQDARLQRQAARERYSELLSDPNLTAQDRAVLQAVGPDGFADFMVQRYGLQAEASQAELAHQRALELQNDDQEWRGSQMALDRRAIGGGGGGGGGYSPVAPMPEPEQRRYSEAVTTAATAAEQARGIIGLLDEFGALNQRTGTGIAAGAMRPFNSDLQRMHAISELLVPMQRAPGSGQMSDRDVEMYRNSVVNIGVGGDVNARTRAVMAARAQNDIDYAEFLTWAETQGLPLANARAAWQDYSNRNRLFNDDGTVRQRMHWGDYLLGPQQQQAPPARRSPPPPMPQDVPTLPYSGPSQQMGDPRGWNPNNWRG